MNRSRNLITLGIVAVLLTALSPAVAPAQSVRGYGEVPSSIPWITPSKVSVDAWLDDAGIPHGMMAFVGGVPFGALPGGPSDPWIIAVTDIVFDGNTAHVSGVVVHSVFPQEIGIEVSFAFTDNTGTGQPDAIDGTPIVAGNITVRN